MEGKWERAATPILKWVIVPLAVFGFGYLVIGPRLGGEAHASTSRPKDTSEVNQRPIQPGKREWKPVSPPQVTISVTRKEEPEPEFDPDYPFEDEALPPDVEPPDDGDVDEAGVGGMAPPVQQSTGGEGDRNDERKSEDPPRKSAFRGIGNWR